MPNRIMLTPAYADDRTLNHFARGLFIAALLIGFLYIGGEFLEPLVIAAILSFILSPVIRVLRNSGLWRTPAVLLTVVAALAVLAALGSTLVVQITQLAEELPQYESTLRAKVKELSGAPLASSALEKASGKLRELGDELGGHAYASVPRPKPMLVEVQQPEPRGLEFDRESCAPPLVSPRDDRIGDPLSPVHPASPGGSARSVSETGRHR